MEKKTEEKILEYLKEISENIAYMKNLIEINKKEIEEGDSEDDGEEEEYKGDYAKCSKCGEEFEAYPYAFNGSDLCEDCTQKEIKEAEITKERIRKELKTDKEFLALKSQNLKHTYILEKYKKESKENKHLFLGSYSRELINLERLGKL